MTDEIADILLERRAFSKFIEEANELLLQLRLFKPGEIRFQQLFQITSITRQITSRKHEISIGSYGDFTLTDEEVTALSGILSKKYQYNSFSDLAIKNFSLVYDIPNWRIRFITLMTCLESLFNLGKRSNGPYNRSTSCNNHRKN